MTGYQSPAILCSYLSIVLINTKLSKVIHQSSMTSYQSPVILGGYSSIVFADTKLSKMISPLQRRANVLQSSCSNNNIKKQEMITDFKNLRFIFLRGRLPGYRSTKNTQRCLGFAKTFQRHLNIKLHSATMDQHKPYHNEHEKHNTITDLYYKHVKQFGHTD